MRRNQGHYGRCGSFALLLLLFLALPAWAGSPKVSYEVIVSESRPFAATVSCEISGFSGDELSLSVAPRYGWIRDFWTNIYELSATQDGRSLPLVKEDVNTWEVQDLKPGRVLIRYSVGVPPRRWPKEGNVHERSVLTRYDGFFTGHALFLTPNLPSLAADVKISVPKGWEIASSWGDGIGPWRVSSRRELVSSYVMMGPCRVYRAKGEGVSYTLAISGTWKFQDRDLLELVRKIGDHYTRTLGEAPGERVFVVCRPGPTGSLAGSALDQSFYMLLDPEIALSLSSFPSSDVPSLLAHEMFHTWTRKLTPRLEDDTLAWFHEGFTNYAAARALLDTGLMSGKAYYSRMAGYWLRVRQNPKIEKESLEEAGKAFFEDSASERLCYEKGALVSWLLDEEIRKDTGGVGSAMKLAANLIQSLGRESGALSLGEIEKAAEIIGKRSYRTFFLAMVQGNSPLPVRETLESLGMKVVSEYRPFFGISYEKQGESLIVSAVADGGPAFRGGMKVGDELLLLDGKPFSATSIPSLKPGGIATLLVRRKGQTLELSVPVGGREIWVVREARDP